MRSILGKWWKRVSITAPASTYLLPIASKQSNAIHSFQTVEGTHTIMQVDPLHFNYYRLTGNALIHSDHRAYYGYPIPLVHEKRGCKKTPQTEKSPRP